MRFPKPLQSIAFLTCLALSGCENNVDALFAPATESSGTSTSQSIALQGFKGCKSGIALDTNKIRVDFEFPSSATRISLYRDGTLVASFDTYYGVTSYTDTNLNQGQTYRYSCEGMIDGVARRGENILSVTTLLVDPPTFAGIASITAKDSHTVTLKWKPATGVPVDHYEVFKRLGTKSVGAIDMTTATPIQTVPLGSIQTTVTGLGDELPYTFAVRACASPVGEDPLCDANSALADVTLPDGNRPQTVGVTLATANNGKVTLTAPWTDTQGAIRKRKIYQNTTGGTDLGNYTLIQTLDVSLTSPELTAPPTSITLLDAVTEGLTYYYIIQDEDATGPNNNLSVASVTIGDQTPPVFAGIASLVNGTVPGGAKKDTVLTAGFTAITSQPADPSGASAYLVYKTQAAFPTIPADPCTGNPTLVASLPAASYASGASVTYELGTLAPRTNFRVCIKARDEAGNISSTVNSLSATTMDITPPTFDGLQTLTYNAGTQKLVLAWNRSPSSDRKEYKIQIWKNTATPTDGQITTLVRSDVGYPSGTSLAATDFAFTDNDVIYAVVNACDDASPNFNATNNCTAYSLASAKSLVVPDSTPPPAFQGVAGPGSFGTPSQGTLSVAWIAPVLWSDYRGFYVYQVNDDYSLSLLRDCACSANGCPTHPTSCTITGLDAFRTYRIHVRAYDATGNITTYAPLNPGAPDFNYTAIRTSDTAAPSFVSNLTVNWDSNAGNQLAWSAASDNQFPSEPGYKIEYKIYRKKDAAFDSPATTPEVDGALLATQETRAYTDPKAGLAEGSTYYYTVCALDASGNRTCDGNVKSQSIADFTPPVVSVIDTDKKNANLYAKTWSLSWTMSDNATATQNLVVTVRKKLAATATDFPALGDSVYNSDTDLWGISGETGPADTATYVNYLVTVQDAAGNKTSKTISIFSDNKGPTGATGVAWVQSSPSASHNLTAAWNKSTAPELTQEQIQFFNNATCDSTNPVEVLGPPALVTLGANPQTKSFMATEGTFSFRIVSWDEANNPTSVCSTPIVVDTQPPYIKDVRAVSGNGTYKTGFTIDVQVEFNEPVNVDTSGGTPTLQLETGAIDRNANYLSGSGTKNLRFRYTVVFGDATPRLNYLSTAALTLNGATIKDGALNSAILTLPGLASGHSLGELSNLVVDTTEPAVFIVSPSATHTNSSTPNLILTALTGTTEMYITNTAGCTGGGVWEPYATSKANWPLAQSNGTAGVFVKYRDSGLVETACVNDTIIHDNIAPSMVITTPAAGSTHGAGLTLQGGCESGINIALSGTGLASPTTAVCLGDAFAIPITFTTGDGTKDITLTQTDLAGNSTSVSRSFIADTTGPTISSITPPANSTYIVGQNLDFTVTFNEPVSLSGTPHLTLIVGNGPKYANCSGSGTSITCRYTVGTGDLDADGIVLSSPLELSGGTVQDALGNNATLTFTTTPYPGVLVDGAGPVINTFTPPTNKTYTVGQALTFTLVFNEPIAVTGSPRLTSTLGYSTKYFPCAKTAAQTLTCSYTTLAGDTDLDGITLANAIDLNGGTLKDSYGNNATLTFTVPNLTGVLVDASPPAAATNLGWQEAAWVKNGAVNAIWTKSASPDLANQKIQFYTGTTPCASPTGSLVDLASATLQTKAYTLTGSGATYWYTIQSIDGVGNTTTSACSSGILFDNNSPGIPYMMVVDDGSTTAGFLDRTPTASWSAFIELDSGIDHYELAVGTSAGGTQVKDWTSVGNVLSARLTGLSLTGGLTYYTSLRAVDRAGNISSQSNGNGWTAQASIDCVNTFNVPAGTRCTDNTIFLGKYNGLKWVATPGGCTDSTNPSCADTADSLFKTADTSYCDDMTYAGYSDWVLPSKNVLSLLRNTGVGGPPSLGLKSDTPYWSSTADGFTNAWVQLFSDGSQASRAKSDQLLVHCVRPLADPCAGTPSLGTLCADDLYYLGTLNTFKYKTTPGGCTDSTTPVCNNSMDGLAKNWGTYGTTTNQTSRTDGPGNTTYLAANYTDTYAAKYCEDMVYEGYTDWFLPGYDELALFSPAQNVIPGLQKNGCGAYGYYWSSTEASSTSANVRAFYGCSGSAFKNTAGYLVRCVRRF